jgi:hypothetical protein
MHPYSCKILNRPLPKFLSVKAIIFFSFWQSVVVALLVAAGIIPEGKSKR